MSKFIVIGKTDCKKVDVKRFEYIGEGKTVYVYIAGKKDPEVINFVSSNASEVWVHVIKKNIES